MGVHHEYAHMDFAIRNIDSGIRTLRMREKDGIKDDTMKDLIMAISLVSYGLQIAMEVIPYRIERLHQKIDRLEKKLGTV